MKEKGTQSSTRPDWFEINIEPILLMDDWSSDPVILENSIGYSVQGEVATRRHTQMHLAREELPDERKIKIFNTYW